MLSPCYRGQYTTTLVQAAPLVITGNNEARQGGFVTNVGAGAAYVLFALNTEAVVSAVAFTAQLAAGEKIPIPENWKGPIQALRVTVDTTLFTQQFR